MRAATPAEETGPERKSHPGRQMLRSRTKLGHGSKPRRPATVPDLIPSCPQNLVQFGPPHGARSARRRPGRTRARAPHGVVVGVAGSLRAKAVAKAGGRPALRPRVAARRDQAHMRWSGRWPKRAVRRSRPKRRRTRRGAGGPACNARHGRATRRVPQALIRSARRPDTRCAGRLPPAHGYFRDSPTHGESFWPAFSTWNDRGPQSFAGISTGSNRCSSDPE